MKISLANALAAGAVGVAGVVGAGVALPALADSATTSPTRTADPTPDGRTSTADPDGSSPGTEQGRAEGDRGPRMEGKGHGRGGPGHGRGAHHGPGPMLGTAAEALGMTEDELVSELQDGSTLGEVADEAGVDREQLVQALMAEHEDRVRALLDEAFPGRPDRAAAAEEGADPEDPAHDDTTPFPGTSQDDSARTG